MVNSRILQARRMCRAVARQPESGLTISSYCRQHRLPLSSFNRWRKILQSEQDAAKPSSEGRDGTVGFVRLIPAVKPEGSGCELSLPDGRLLRMPPDFPVETLLAVLKGSAV
jgi:hypothetical protein